MSALDDIVLLCEGVDGGLDVTFLELARRAVQHAQPLALRVAIKPAGSKADLRPAVRARRDVWEKRHVFAVRDRDFLRRPRLEEARRKALSLVEDEPPAFPLRRHCIESYLIEPRFVEAAVGIAGAATKLSELAERRRWVDVCRAALDDVDFRMRGLRPRMRKETASSAEEAIRVVERKLEEYRGALVPQTRQPTVSELVQEIIEDFEADGPLWTRVDGCELLAGLRDWLDDQNRLPGGDLHRLLRKHAERVGPPAPLVEEMTELLGRLAGLSNPPAPAP